MQSMKMEVYVSSASGKKMQPTKVQKPETINHIITLAPEQKYQTILGFGGAFTESTAYVLNQLSEAKRDEVLDAYFGDAGAAYSLTRTHINSCDFSLTNYAYDEHIGDTSLLHFSIVQDEKWLIPMMQDAMKKSTLGFKIIASPWTAPPWMKDNNDWKGGKLKPEYYSTWAAYFVKYLEAYRYKGLPMWGITVENEPLGNGNNWESMLFTPKEMTDFVVEHLKPNLKNSGWEDLVVLGYDQNRAHLKPWVDELYRDEASMAAFDGTAIHWYESTYEVFPKELNYAHEKAPDKYLIQTEACIDAEVPVWNDDAWYWSKEATDWGFDWAPEKDKYLHPKYVPTHRYARDIIGCLNHWVDGWIDWNMVLDKTGGPNWAKNWCIAPVLVDPEVDEVYYTPLYYIMSHFSKFMRPGAQRIEHICEQYKNMQQTAAINNDGSIVLQIFNPELEDIGTEIQLGNQSFKIILESNSLSTLVFNNNSK